MLLVVGMGSKENFELVKQLAEVCGGVVGATRPATEDEWIPRSHQVGQSGKIVAPKLYCLWYIRSNSTCIWYNGFKLYCGNK